MTYLVMALFVMTYLVNTKILTTLFVMSLVQHASGDVSIT